MMMVVMVVRMMMVVLLLLVEALPLPVAASQCVTSSDCPSPHAPHCSKWGWCQWTGLYGQEGPVQGQGLPPGECVSSRDCTPRAPVCSSLGYCTQSTQHNPVTNPSIDNPLIQRSRSKPVGAVQVTVPAGTIHLSTSQAKTQAKDLRQRGVSEGRTLLHGEEYQANHGDDGDKYQANHGDDIYQKTTYEIYRTNKGDQGLAGPQYQDTHDGGPQNNNDQPFDYNLPTGMEREQVRHAWLDAESGTRQINVQIKSQQGHWGVAQQPQANIKHRDQLPQGSIASKKKLEPILVANRFNVNKKNEKKLAQNNYTPHLPLSNTPRTDMVQATLQSTSHGQTPSQHFNPVPAVPTFGQKSAHASFDYPDYSEYPDYYRTNRNDEYDINDQEYYYYDDYYYDYSLGTQDILKSDALNHDDPLNSETIKVKNDYSEERDDTNDKVDEESYHYSGDVRINKLSLSNDQSSVNKKSTNRFPFITENKSDGRKPPETSSNKAASKPAASKPAKLAKIVENPLPGESQGCLIDCVYECVAIELLTAYRDCVKFCGNACT